MEGRFTNVHMCTTQLMFYAAPVLLASLDSCSRFVSSFASIICPYHPTGAFQNGPLHILANYSLVENQYAWSTVADYVWIDQPVYVRILVNVEVDTTVYYSGTGFSTVDADGLGEHIELCSGPCCLILHSL